MILHILVLFVVFIGFAEALIMALIDWEDLPISVRKSPRKLYKILKEELELPRDWNSLSVIERRSRKKRYNIVKETLTVLPSWDELDLMDRRSHKRLYRIIQGIEVPKALALSKILTPLTSGSEYLKDIDGTYFVRGNFEVEPLRGNSCFEVDVTARIGTWIYFKLGDFDSNKYYSMGTSFNLLENNTKAKLAILVDYNGDRNVQINEMAYAESYTEDYDFSINRGVVHATFSFDGEKISLKSASSDSEVEKTVYVDSELLPESPQFGISTVTESAVLDFQIHNVELDAEYYHEDAYDVEVSVTDGESPIEGAAVTVGHSTLTTGNDGSCTFPRFLARTYDLKVSAAGYGGVKESIVVDSDHTDFAIALGEPHVLELSYDASIDQTFSTFNSTPFVFDGNLEIDYGDGTTETVSANRQLTHTYDDTDAHAITITGDITELKHNCLKDCTGLTGFDIPDSVAAFGNSVFMGCTGLISAIIPATVASYGVGCFKNCTSLSSANILSPVADVKQETFMGCTSLTSVNVSSSARSFGNNVFMGCTGLTCFDIPNNITSLGDNCFKNCTGLTSIAIPNTITRIPSSCFNGCSSLTSINIPDSVSDLGRNAFYNCSSLTSVNIPSLVTSLESDIWSGCNNLIDYQLYWETPPMQYSTYKFKTNADTIFTIPDGTAQAYVNAGYPSDRLQERSA